MISFQQEKKVTIKDELLKYNQTTLIPYGINFEC